jgi:hypothetical protein
MFNGSMSLARIPFYLFICFIFMFKFFKEEVCGKWCISEKCFSNSNRVFGVIGISAWVERESV